MTAAAPSPCIGRFAPSPTGALHAGSLVAALASWLDARAHGGRWLVRIEDVDTPRCVPGADQLIPQQLAALGLVPDEPPLYQSQRGHLYQAALDTLVARDLAYPCACTRADIAQANAALGLAKTRHGELVYPGTCRPENGGLRGRAPRAWRLKVPQGPAALWTWHDRRLGPQTQALDATVGDFVIRRADGLWAYQLAVVVDDADQGITHIVRGEDLADNTPRQQWLQQCLDLPTPTYLHTPLVLDPHGEKLSKQHGAKALQPEHALTDIQRAGAVLGLCVSETTLEKWLESAQKAWPWC
ncbi:tRNA glutamyl-Q(34) synthetase GluQRS [Aquabacterium sp. CECT 9606]|uniref:tRNA glutamyl-Q(34) synthetase GluQRS n=1 Tax=Aquabacterium sp. CECT 9606 TaxID=2845822 RepID=UPI001E3C1DB1|nr:tRNA glutamyl-Q(34) synthetase GluQRS [Aquabacterium sp. CECT 9606]CAH0354399.1 Glutamyl-Q tRNA(Asp) synthetase [Aquabacterium sp. CECT 9606]